MNPISKSLAAVAGVALAAMVAASSAQAHHSFAMFDRTKRVTLVGTVKAFQWTNPHSWVQLNVPGAQSEVEEWSIEALSPNVLGRQGWKRNTLNPGDKVSVVINPLRDGSKGGNLIAVTLPSGETLGGGAG